jgi:hypothetical protein
MKKIFSLVFILIFFFYTVVFAGGLQATVEATIDTDATFDPIAITATTTAQCFRIHCRTDVTWYLSKVPAGTTYSTFADGESLEICFQSELQGPYTFGYGQSSSGDIVIEILPFDIRK